MGSKTDSVELEDKTQEALTKYVQYILSNVISILPIYQNN